MDDSTCVSLREDLKESHDFSEVSDADLSKLISHLKEYVKHIAAQQKYDESRIMHALLQECIEKRRERIYGKDRILVDRETIESRRRDQEEAYVSFWCSIRIPEIVNNSNTQMETRIG
jgi:hypothetical protein